MKISFLIAAFFICSLSVGQNVYTSRLTQFFPSTATEVIDRVITFDKDRITIKTVTPDDKVKIQTLKINGKITNYDSNNKYFVYKCSSRSGRSPITVMIKEDKPDFITLLQPSLTDRTQLEELKLYLDK